LLDWAVVIVTGLISPIIGSLVFRKFWPRTVAML